MNIKQQRLLSLGLTVINTAGVIGTFIFTSKEAPEAKKRLAVIPKENKKDRFITFIKSYKKSLIFAGATIASGIGSRVVSYKTEASLIATATMLEASLHKYKNKIKQTLGIDADKNIVKEIIKDDFDKPETEPREGEVLYKEEHLGYFYAKPENIYKVMLMVNSDMMGDNYQYNYQTDTPGIFTLGDFVSWTGARLLSHNLDENIFNIGWNWDYLAEWWELCSIHFDISEPDSEDGARLIYWFEEPIWNPEEWYYYVDGTNSSDNYWKNAPTCINRNSAVYDIKTI